MTMNGVDTVIHSVTKQKPNLKMECPRCFKLKDIRPQKKRFKPFTSFLRHTGFIFCFNYIFLANSPVISFVGENWFHIFFQSIQEFQNMICFHICTKNKCQWNIQVSKVSHRYLGYPTFYSNISGTAPVWQLVGWPQDPFHACSWWSNKLTTGNKKQIHLWSYCT